jgi:outer membrane protein TolC
VKRLIVIPLFTTIYLNATTMTELFDALSNQPITKLDTVSFQKATLTKGKIDSLYYPKVDLFGNYTHYNSSTNLIPVDPITTAKLTKDNDAFPFAQSIEQIGLKVSMPLFIKELSTLSKKADALIESSKLKKRLNLYQNEALIVGYNASLEYLYNLLLALNQTKSSLYITLKDIKVSVNSGRTPAIALYKIEEKLNSLDISINNIELQKIQILSNIEDLTSIEIVKPLKMKQISKIDKRKLFALEPLNKNLDASRLDLQAIKEKKNYPKVSLNLMWSENYTSNTVNNQYDKEGYGYYQVGMEMPLYNKSLDTDIEIGKIAVMKNRLKLEKSRHSLIVEAKKIEREITLLRVSEDLTLINIKKRDRLLKYAKVDLDIGRMTEEDYLQYEDDLLQAKAKYYEIGSKKWQNLAKLAVIYGNDLKGIIK